MRKAKRAVGPVRGVVLALALVWVAGAAWAADEGWGYEIADEIMSPFCPGRALSECPSPQAGELRAWILSQEEEGVPREEVEAELFRQWGEGLRQSPKAEGVGLVAYAIPAAAFALGGGLVVFFLRRQRSGAPAPAPGGEVASAQPSSADDDLQRQIDEEMGQA